MLKKYIICISLLLTGNVALPDIQASNATTEAEIDCLAQTTYHESRGEPYEGKVAVAQVALNRVRSGEFPDSICRVVKQRTRGTCQFSWVCQKKRIVRSSEEFLEEKRLATAVYYGMVEDVTKGATHFHNKSVNPSWARKFKLTARIGNHSFYRKPLNAKAHQTSYR